MSEDSKNSNKKDEFLHILKNVEHDAQDMIFKGREIVEQGQFIADLASCNEEYISCLPDDSALSERQWNNQIDSWRRLHNYASSANSIYGKIDRLYFATDSTSVASSAAISLAYIPSLPPPSQEPARKAFERFSRIIEKSHILKELESEIQRLELTTSMSNNESILSLLSQTDQAFKVPSISEVSSVAVLIPLREAINRTLADLLQRRQSQEKTKNNQEKVRSICAQCCFSGVDDTQIEQLANEANDLNKLLSEAKQEAMNRDSVRELMNRGFLFLRSFMRTLDKNRMRK
jgi:hypothetical protein